MIIKVIIIMTNINRLFSEELLSIDRGVKKFDYARNQTIDHPITDKTQCPLGYQAIPMDILQPILYWQQALVWSRSN